MTELGAQALQTKELIALLIGSRSREASTVELAEKMLYSVGGDLPKLSQMSFSELSSFKGMGMGKCCAVLSAIELSRRINSTINLPFKRATRVIK